MMDANSTSQSNQGQQAGDANTTLKQNLQNATRLLLSIQPTQESDPSLILKEFKAKGGHIVQRMYSPSQDGDFYKVVLGPALIPTDATEVKFRSYLLQETIAANRELLVTVFTADPANADGSPQDSGDWEGSSVAHGNAVVDLGGSSVAHGGFSTTEYHIHRGVPIYGFRIKLVDGGDTTPQAYTFFVFITSFTL